MQMYSEKDLELGKEKLPPIIEQIEKAKIEPVYKMIMDLNAIVLDFVKTKKRKIYGGYAQNKVISDKDPKDAFYGSDEIPDIDVYTPDPLSDLVELCDIFYAKGYRNIMGSEAQHKETYKIHVDSVPVIDLSYVPRNIYNRIPFVEIDGIIYVHPSFVYIDLYRMLSEPYFSSRRWEKVFPRLYLLQKHYPFNKASSKLTDAYDVPKNLKEQIKGINNLLCDLIKNKESFIVTGQYAYNCLLEESGIMKDKTLGSKYHLIDTPFMQLISTNYIPDCVEIIKELRVLLNNDDKLTFKEFYPLWMFTGYSVVIYYDNFPVLHITAHNNRCTPCHKIKPLCNVSATPKKDFVQIGSFDFIFLMNLISTLRVRVNDQKEKYHYHNIMTSQLIEMREYYFKKNKLTLFDDSLFQSFIPICTGETMDPMKEVRLLREKKFKEGKLVVYRYNPENKAPPPDYKFANTSGNDVHYPANLKITKYLNNELLLDEFKNKSFLEKTEINEENEGNEK